MSNEHMSKLIQLLITKRNGKWSLTVLIFNGMDEKMQGFFRTVQEETLKSEKTAGWLICVLGGSSQLISG